MAASFRVVGGPTPFSDKQEHTVTLTDTVAAGETVVFFVACSVTDINGIVGYVDAESGALIPGGPWLASQASWQLDEEFGAAGGGGYNGVSCFSCYMPNGLASGTGIQFGVKFGSGGTFDASGFYHGQSPYAVAVALNSGDGRFMVYDTSDSSSTGATSTPASPSIVTADEAIVLGFFGGTGTAGAGWFTPGSGWTELADTAQGTESNFNIALQGRLAATSFSGTSSGTSSVTNNFGTIIVSYKASTVEPPKVPVVLAGTRATGTTADFFSSGNTAAWPFTALTSGRSQRMYGRFHEENTALTANSVKLGIYDHDGANNRPGNLLGSGTVTPNPVAMVPFGAAVVGVPLVKGTTYWLAVSGAGEQVDISGVSAAGVGREGTGNMVAKWVAGGNMGATPSIWIEGLEVGATVSTPDRMPLGV